MPSHNFFHSLVPAGEWVGNLTNMELARSSVIGLVLGSALGLVIRREMLGTLKLHLCIWLQNFLRIMMGY